MKSALCFYLGCVLLLPGCGGAGPGFDRIGEILLGTPRQFQSRQIIVTLSEAVRSDWETIHQDILNRFDVQAAGKFPLTSIGVNCLVYQVSDMVDTDEIVRRLRGDRRIRLVQMNQLFVGQGPDTRAYRELSYGPRLIHADITHKAFSGKGVKIAVIDTGADQTHAELKGRIIARENFVEGGDGSFLEDRHGTAVAGVIAARTDDGLGIDGIAPEAGLELYKACWYPGPMKAKAVCSSWTLAKAIDAAINQGSRIINLSLGGPPDDLLAQLLSKADEKGIVIVAATLERNPEPGFPASLEFVIPVISADPHGNFAVPGWRRPAALIAAPGVEVLTTAPHNGYDFLSGSSLATAHVSGVAALLLQQRPTLSPRQLKTLLLATGQNSAGGATVRLIDACRALLNLQANITCP